MQGASELPVAIGDVVAEKYRVERLIGRGGMGSVFQATHLQLLQRVALKFLSSSMLRQEEARTRFGREARAAAALSSDHVARVIDVGVLPNDVPYLVIEYLEGEDLAARLERGPVPVDEAVKLFMQACDALGEAHRMGIVHRDIKPHNLFLVKRANGGISLKVLDFGIAKVAHPGLAAAEVITGTCAVMGTPQYMAPEQMASTRAVDPAADVWALGVCLYECLTKRRPFESGNMLELGALVMSGSPTAITTHRGDLPPSVVAIIDRCLSKDPARRFPDANALHDALASVEEKMAIVVAPPTLVTPQFVSASPKATMPMTPMTPMTAQTPQTLHSSGMSFPPAAPLQPTSTSFQTADFTPPPAAPARSSSRTTTAIGLGFLAAVVVVAIGVNVLRPSGNSRTTTQDPPPAALVAPPPGTRANTTTEPTTATGTLPPILLTATPGTAPPTASKAAVKPRHPPPANKGTKTGTPSNHATPPATAAPDTR